MLSIGEKYSSQISIVATPMSRRLYGPPSRNHMPRCLAGGEVHEELFLEIHRVLLFVFDISKYAGCALHLGSLQPRRLFKCSLAYDVMLN